MSKAVFVFIFALAAVECSEMGVTFSGMQFTMTCPNEGNEVTWTNEAEGEKEGGTLTLTYDEKTKGTQVCTVDTVGKYYFYVKGRVCPNCYELDGKLLMGAIFVDLLITGGIIMVIYNCARRKSSPAHSPAPASARPNRGNAPSVPDRDYEPLNPATRETATYAGVHR